MRTPARSYGAAHLPSKSPRALLCCEALVAAGALGLHLPLLPAHL